MEVDSELKNNNLLLDHNTKINTPMQLLYMQLFYFIITYIEYLFIETGSI